MSSIEGTQVVSRIAAIFRVVSQAMPAGAGTSAIALKTEITRPTAHRLLSSLASEGFIDRDQRTGHWLLGPEMYLMGALAADRFDVTEIAREHVSALAELTSETAFLSARRAGETVCLTRVEGSFPIRSFVLFEGKRFPLGVASAGLSILSFLPPHVIERYLTEAALENDYGSTHSASNLQARITKTRELGFAVNPGLIVEGSWGMGAAVFDSNGQPAWALSITGIESRFTESRIEHHGQLLLHHAHLLTEKLRDKST